MSKIVRLSKTTNLVFNTLSILILITFISAQNSNAQGNFIKDGIAVLEANKSYIELKNDIKGLIFDTSACSGCKDTMPSWRFLSDLKIDSLVYLDSTVFFDNSEKSNDIAINSSDLIQVLEDVNTYQLLRRVPWAVPGDTLAFDSIRQRTVVKYDMSEHYLITFNDNLNVDSICSWLADVSELESYGPLPVEIQDEVDCPVGLEAVEVNDFNNQWHLGPKFEDQFGQMIYGIDAECAWDYLEDGQRGNFNYLAILDFKADTNHSDLGNLINEFDPAFIFDPFDDHSTGVTGIAIATANNGEHYCGVAPDANAVVFYKDFVGGVVSTINWIFFDEYHEYGLPSAFLYPYSHKSYDEAFYQTMYNCRYVYQIPFITTSGDIRFDHPTSPDTGAYPSYPSMWDDLSISVGGHGSTGNHATWSNYTCDLCDDQVDVLAPGVYIPTTDVNNDTQLMSGTSASAPVVAGMVMMAITYAELHDIDLSVDQIEAFLENTAYRDHPEYDPIKYGSGNANMLEFMKEVVNSTATKEQTKSDSIPCLIITNFARRANLESLALSKTKRGTKTAIEMVEIIDTAYTGNDLQERIRNCIKDYVTNHHTEYVILGGDETIIPFRYAYNDTKGPGVRPICDYYYACLDGDWNYDSDTLFGEVEDSVDLVPEVAIGRLPFSSSGDMSSYLTKLYEYETSVSTTWRESAFFTGASMFNYGDGVDFCQDLQEVFPLDFSISEIYDLTGGDADSVNYISNFNNGHGIVIQYALSGTPREIWVDRTGYWETWENVCYWNIDTLKNYGTPSVVYSATCHNLEMDSAGCMAISYMKCDSAGAVAYIGHTYNDYIFRSHPAMKDFFSQLFGDGPKEIGKLLNDAKSKFASRADREGSFRHNFFGYTLLGDPQMRIWTDEPEQLSLSCPSTLDTGFHSVIYIDVEDESENPVESVLVCISDGGSTIYGLGYTLASGTAAITNVTIPSIGTATVVASKHNYFDDECEIDVVGSGGGCPMLYVYDGYHYRLVNSIMSKSEDELNNSNNNNEGYPIYAIPATGKGDLKLRIKEDEQEQSYFDLLNVSYVSYPEDNKVAYTNNREFKTLTGDSLLPVAAFDHEGKSILAQVGSFDDNLFEASGPGYCTITYKLKNEEKRLKGGMGGGIEPPPGGGKKSQKLAKIGPLEDVCNTITVSALVSDNVWEAVDIQYPRINDAQIYSDLSRYFENTEITIKISWIDEISIDCLPFYFWNAESLPQYPLSPSVTLHSKLGDIYRDITEYGSDITLIPGQYIDLEYSTIPNADGYKNAYAFNTFGRYIKFSEDGGEKSDGFSFEQNFPNPFNPTTSFSFALPTNMHVNLTIYNVLGQTVNTLIDKQMSPGKHQIVWNGKNAQGRTTASGVYFAKFTAGEFTKTRKLTILK